MGLDALPVVLRRLLGEARVVDPAHHVVVDPLHDGEEDGGARAPARAVERAVGGALRVGVVALEEEGLDVEELDAELESLANLPVAPESC